MSTPLPTPRVLRWIAPLCAVLACASPEIEVGARVDSVVYGDDDRTDWYAHPSADWRLRARESIVALVPSGNLDTSDPDDVRVTGETLGERRDLCEGERFRDHPTGANCSGTLIDRDLVLTAGHCVESLGECTGTRFVFDYRYEADGVLANISMDEDVYECRQLVAQQNGGGLDYAVVQLDRPVVAPHAPAPTRTMLGALPTDTPLVVIGFGSGIPMKIDDGGEVLSPRAGSLDWFGANLDTFGGNSGSGVFDATTGEVVGILVRGERDYRSEGDCNVVNTLPERPGDGSEEECTYAARAVEALCETDVPSALCDGTPLCRLCTGADECPEGWSCESMRCSPPCADGCPPEFTCGADGFCEPDATPICAGGDVVALRCGRTAEVLETCRPTGVCEVDECVPAGPGNHCGDAIEVAPETQTIRGTIGDRHTDEYVASCAADSAEAVYAFTLDRRFRVEAYASGYDTLLHLRSVCDDASSEIACDDDAGERTDAYLDLELDAGTYFLFMDGWSGRRGDYVLDLTFTALEVPDAGMPDGGMPDAGMPDGGMPDGGMPGVRDGGSPIDAGPDAGRGVPPIDAGPIFRPDGGAVVRPDAGPVRPDAGPDAGPPVEAELVTFRWGSGCGCRVAGTAAPGRTPWGLGLLGMTFWLRTRRRRAKNAACRRTR